MAERCSNCGRELDGQRCIYCDTLADAVKSYQLYGKGHVGFAFLGFLFPFVGFLIYIAFRQRHPEGARFILIGVIISTFIAIVLGLAFVAMFAFSQ